MYEVEPSDQGSWYDCFLVGATETFTARHCGFFDLGPRRFSVNPVKEAPTGKIGGEAIGLWVGTGLKAIYVNKLTTLPAGFM